MAKVLKKETRTGVGTQDVTSRTDPRGHTTIVNGVDLTVQSKPCLWYGLPTTPGDFSGPILRKIFDKITDMGCFVIKPRRGLTQCLDVPILRR